VASEPIRIQETIKFEDFELDPRAYELRRGGRVLKLERIPMDVLLLLVEQRGLLVTRDQIVERIWGKSVFLDTDNSINGAIRKVRQVLKDDPENPRFVQTVTAKGYRFVAPVIDDGISLMAMDTLSERRPAVSESLPGAETSDTHIPRVWPFRQRLILLGIFMVLIAAAGVYVVRSRSEMQVKPSGSRLLLAVLPFENLTGDVGQDYFSDGLTEEMITELGRQNPERLGVIARTSVMFYKHSPKPLAQIGRELGVQYVLEGSVRRDSNNVRVTAQLIQVKDQTHLWAQEYDRDLKDLLVVQGEIARKIADEMQVALGGRKETTPLSQPSLSPQTYEAYDLYLKGQYFWNKRTTEGFQRGIEYYQRAIAKDPNYAPAYAGLADSYILLGEYNQGPQSEFVPKARAAALRAVAIDANLAEAHTALALIVQNFDYDWQTAEKEFKRAIELNPNYATAHHWYAEHLMWQGRFDEALGESERARLLDPFSLIIAADNGVILYCSRQYDHAIEKFLAIREMDPTFAPAGWIRRSYAQKGMYAEVLADIEKQRRLYGDGPWMFSERAYVYGLAGQQARAQVELAKLEDWSRRQPLDPGIFVAPYIGMGNKDQAFFWLEKAYAQRSGAMTWLKVDPVYDPLRSDPRFQNLLRRVGLAR
jgi:TolB-like protein/DNA-binding winged helix-turn-helix (wHTH) protein/Tfp pilus assembly protein PilF